MRRKHQQTFGKREYIREIPKKAEKLYSKKISEETDSIIQNPEAIHQSFEAAENDIKVRTIGNILNVAIPIALLFAIGVMLFLLNKEPANKQENVILRHYSEVLRKLDDEPEDITASPYQSNIPKVIQKDIDKMMTMGEDASIVYYNDARDQIVIEASNNSENGYKVYFREAMSPYSSISIEELTQYVSFYKRDSTLVVYGGEFGRRIDRYIMDNEKMKSDRLEDYIVDLYGTGIREEDVDSVRYFNSDCTIIKKGSEFSMYVLGEKVYTKNFSGEVKKWDYDYLQTANGDCYNVYFCTDLDDRWIEFVKVAEKVDEILVNENITILDENGYNMRFNMLRIGNKKYAQIPDAATERAYGQNYGSNNNKDKSIEPDFTIQLVEVSALSSSRVEIVCKEEDYRENSYIWYLRYYFQSGDREGYIEKRINGLDSQVSKMIPQSKIDMFNKKVILPDEIAEYINQLKLLYDEYTDNTF